MTDGAFHKDETTGVPVLVGDRPVLFYQGIVPGTAVFEFTSASDVGLPTAEILRNETGKVTALRFMTQADVDLAHLFAEEMKSAIRYSAWLAQQTAEPPMTQGSLF